MEKKMICTECGCSEIIGRMDFCYEDHGSIVTRKIYGFCKECFTPFRWTEKFSFIGYEDFEEVVDE